jgi:hypothetical protein
MRTWLAIAFVGFFLFGCGSGNSDQLELDVQIASNQTNNPFAVLAPAFQSGQSRGIFFRLDAMSANPVGINNTTGEPIVEPSLSSGLGFDPASEFFSLPSELLAPGQLYRLQMYALNSEGATTHVGTADCPIGQNISTDITPIVICFGLAGGQEPLCGGTTPFGCCPGIDAVACP